MLMKRTEKLSICELYNCLQMKSQRIYRSTPGPKKRLCNVTGCQSSMGSQVRSYGPTLSNCGHQSQDSHCGREKLQTGEVEDARMTCGVLV